MPHLSGWWWLVGVLALVSLGLVVWAILDVLRRPAWQFSPGRKVMWAVTLVGGWLLGLWPLVLVSSLLYLVVLRRRLPATNALAPTAQASVPPATAAPVPLNPSTLPPAGWYADPSGAHGERWWDGLGWTAHQRPYPS